MPDLSGFVAQKAFEITLKSDHITQEHTARLTHYHNTFEVMFLLASENIFFIKDTPLQTARGHMILIPPYTVHNIEYKIHTDYTRYVLYFEAAFFSAALEAAGGHDALDALRRSEVAVYPLNARVFGKFEKVFASLLELYCRMEGGDSAAAVKSRLLLSSFAVQLRAMRPLPLKNAVGEADPIQKIVTYLDEHFSQPVTLDSLAAQFYMSKYNLCRAFRLHTGLSVIEYLQYRRISEVQKRMLSNAEPLIEIAYSCGFNNLPHFYRVFKKVVGTTPKAYQARLPAPSHEA